MLLEVITILKVNNIVGNKVEKITIDLHLLPPHRCFPNYFFCSKLNIILKKKSLKKKVYCTAKLIIYGNKFRSVKKYHFKTQTSLSGGLKVKSIIILDCNFCKHFTIFLSNFKFLHLSSPLQKSFVLLYSTSVQIFKMR